MVASVALFSLAVAGQGRAQDGRPSVFNSATEVDNGPLPNDVVGVNHGGGPDEVVHSDPVVSADRIEDGAGTEEPACDFSGWVGKPVDQVALKATGRDYRILKPDAPATRDFQPGRINVYTDEKGGTVLRVSCS